MIKITKVKRLNEIILVYSSVDDIIKRHEPMFVIGKTKDGKILQNFKLNSFEKSLFWHPPQKIRLLDYGSFELTQDMIVQEYSNFAWRFVKYNKSELDLIISTGAEIIGQKGLEDYIKENKINKS
ncbi:MAG: hypothetical protein WC812_01780 [Candidatus Pacearchaeota archaeon]|jgi:hypothetical protein